MAATASFTGTLDFSCSICTEMRSEPPRNPKIHQYMQCNCPEHPKNLGILASSLAWNYFRCCYDVKSSTPTFCVVIPLPPHPSVDFFFSTASSLVNCIIFWLSPLNYFSYTVQYKSAIGTGYIAISAFSFESHALHKYT
jgi:hypothetical protein